MTGKVNWAGLAHEDKLRVLRDSTVDQIMRDYEIPGQDQREFQTRVARERLLWQVDLYADAPIQRGAPPNKEVVLGAWRDLDRSEAILELIDNSVDAWSRRKNEHPAKVAPELNIEIAIDAATGLLTYEDNAGGVSVDNLENLVVPGYSQTTALAHSIGSYKTGGKKAIFRLATAANILTRYWNPAETSDQAVSVHLDEEWLTDVNRYEFPYYVINDKTGLEKGQTRYVMQLRVEPVGSPWFKNPEEYNKIRREIEKTYSLLMSRQRAINIFFPTRERDIRPQLEKLYDFTGAHDKKVDIRPQVVRFNLSLDFEGTKAPITVEIAIGCRVTVGAGDGQHPGFDLYGNNRLFVSHDQRLFAEFLPQGNPKNLIRGFVNILGPNIFVPWDTHKRHLNYDREVISILKTHPAVKQLFDGWREAANQISRLGSGNIKRMIETPLKPLVDPRTGELAITHQSEVKIDPERKRGQSLPADVFVPKIGPTKAKKDHGIVLNISFPIDDARQLAARLQVVGSIEATSTRRQLAEKARERLMLIAKRG